jgi:serine/threonine protein kinase
MPIAIGTRLGPYEIVSAIGAGGMGEVYRARDTRLNRDVAIKVLPDALAQDPDRMVIGQIGSPRIDLMSPALSTARLAGRPVQGRRYDDLFTASARRLRRSSSS